MFIKVPNALSPGYCLANVYDIMLAEPFGQCTFIWMRDGKKINTFFSIRQVEDAIAAAIPAGDSRCRHSTAAAGHGSCSSPCVPQGEQPAESEGADSPGSVAG